MIKKSRIRCKSGNSLCSSTPTKTKKSKQEDFYNEHMTEIILFESAKKYLKENLGESKTLNISKWKSELSKRKRAYTIKLKNGIILNKIGL